MFSGIVAAVGRITDLSPRNDGTPTVRLTIDAGTLDLADVAQGDSIACSGVCLTVVEKQGNTFAVDVSPETLSCTVGLAAIGPVKMMVRSLPAGRLEAFMDGLYGLPDASVREQLAGFAADHGVVI